MTGEIGHQWKTATITIEFYDGTIGTIELHDDLNGIRLAGEVHIEVEPRQVESNEPWAAYEPGQQTASVRLSGRSTAVWR